MDIEIDLGAHVENREEYLGSNKSWRRTLDIEINNAIYEACMPYFCTALVYLPGDAIPAKGAVVTSGIWNAHRGDAYRNREFHEGINGKRHAFIRRSLVNGVRRNRLANSFVWTRLP